MRICAAVGLAMAMGVGCAGMEAQVPGAAALVQTVKPPSAILQPAITSLRSVVDGVRLDKWKGAGSLRDETDANIGSIRRDLDNTLPGLLAAADGAPNSVSKVMPAYRNVEALYDVLLRVDAAARMAAPSQQSAALDQAMAGLDQARRDLGDRLQSSGLAQEKQVSDLQAALKAAPAAAPAPVCAPVTPPAKKKKPAAKPAAKSGTTAR